MKILKKQFSVLMTLLMILSLIPMTAFADEKVSVIGGVQTFTNNDKNKEVKLLVKVDKYLNLKQGRVIFELNNAMLAKTVNPAAVEVRQGNTVITSPDVVFQNTNGKTLMGGETMFNLEFNKDIASVSQETEVVITLKLDFSESNLGDVSLSIEDIGKDGTKTGLGSIKSVLAKDFNQGLQDPDVRASQKDAMIGPAGGKLSPITIYRFEKLSTKESENKIKVLLPGELFFLEETTVEKNKGKVTVSYSSDKKEMTITGIDNKTEFLTIKPVVALQAKDNVKLNKIEAKVDFMSNDKMVSAQSIQIGQFKNYGITLSANQKGIKDIPTLQKGYPATIELTIDAVEGTLSNGTVIDLQLEKAHIVYGTLKVTEPSGIVLTSSKSAGKEDRNKISGYEVYSETNFSLRSNKNDLKKIKLEMDIIANPLTSENAMIKARTVKSEDQKIDVAKINQGIKLAIVPKSFEKGKRVELPAVTINETVAKTLQPEDKIYLELVYFGSDREKGEHIAFDTAKDIKIETKGDIEVRGIEFANQQNILVLTIKNRSDKTPGTIMISNLKGYLSEKAVKGKVTLKASINSAVADEQEFFTVSLGPTVGKTIFAINNKQYVSNGVQMTLVTAPYIKEGRTMLPVRAVGQSLGLSAQWNNVTKTATFSNDEKVAVVKIGESTITVNGTKYPLSVPAEIKDGSTMIELRSLANAFSTNIQWNAATKTVTVN